MCGIAGFVLSSAPPDAEARLTRMTDAVRHRGPDGEGFLLHDRSGGGLVGLGHRRLAIIDLTTGQQPIYHQGAGVTLVFNGEIYNFQALRRELEAKGHAFRTTSDTEVLLNAYVEWGPDCVARLRGMFAFAIWDAPRRRLMLARDPFGKKPLFLYEDKDRLLFGWLPDNLLERGDRITMAASIEARMPFIDKELTSFVARLPDRWRIRGLTQKYILRRAMQDVLPAEILSRPKVGFRVPVNEWFRGPMRGFVRDHLGRQNHEKLIWALMNLELFQRRVRLA